MTEGKKTAGLEILEDLGWNPPDAIFTSVGDGSIIGGLHKAVKDALALGWIDRAPRIFGIQSSGSDFMVQAFESGEDVYTKAPISAVTAADSISADLPRDRIKAMAAVVDTGVPTSGSTTTGSSPRSRRSPAAPASSPSRRRPPPMPASRRPSSRVSSVPATRLSCSARAPGSRMSLRS